MLSLAGLSPRQATLNRVILAGCNLFKANLSKANIAGSCLEGINLSQANLSQTNFCVDKNANIPQVIETIQANLAASLEHLPPEIAAQTVELMSEELQEVILPISLKKANLTQANLAEANLRQAYLNDADLTGANLTNANLSKADLRGADLSHTNLTGVNFAGANLSQANLTGATIDGDSLSKAALGWTIMPDASVSKNPALELIATKLNSLERKAWFPVTIRKDGDLTASKFAGYPRWVQDPEYPNCPICDRSMNQLIFEFASDDNIPYLWGDSGTGYFLQCPEHKEQVAFLGQCG